jgi:peptidylprolyl isomerase
MLVQGQTKKRTGRRTRVVKPTTAVPVKESPVTITPSGLIYVITKRTEGRLPKNGETVIVNYTGVLTDGVKFDSSLDRGEPFKFKLGEGRVIKGWDEGVAKLRVGEQATLIIPPQLGYGARGAGGVIPGEATLIFIVQLMGIEESAPAN